MRRGESEKSSQNGWSQQGNDYPTNNNGEEEWIASAPPLHHNNNNRPVPGRPRKRLPTPPISGSKPTSSRKKKANFCSRFHAKWIKGSNSTGRRQRKAIEGFSPSVMLAIVLWYLLGVMSIGTSKLLLSKPKRHHQFVGNVPPLYLTLQQLLIGSWFFRFLLNMKALGSSGLQPWPTSGSPKKSHRQQRHLQKSKIYQQSGKKSPEVVLAGLFFGLGFFTTNYSFQQSSAAFVETIKAAEPITSAGVAVTWGIETLGTNEIISLATIVAGVLISTVANGSQAISSSSSASLTGSIESCLWVMVTNLCFSFRGLHQKLFRASPHGSVAAVDDLNLQYRMQQVGVAVFIIPVILIDGLDMMTRVWHLYWSHGLIHSGALLRYVLLSVVNGLAFASYNLASTYVLSRISVVHHAALNCIRRIFAIVVTSIAFGIPITWLGSFGISVSFIGFMCFTHYKAKRQRQPRPLSSLLPMSAV